MADSSERIRIVFSCREWRLATCASVFHKRPTPCLAHGTLAIGGGPPSGLGPPQTFDTADVAGGDTAGGDAAGGDVGGGDVAGGDAASGDVAGGDAADGDAAGGDEELA